MNAGSAVVACSAFLVAILLPIPLRPILTWLGAVDEPNARSSHTLPVLRGGGIAQALSMLLVLGLVAATARHDQVFLLALVLVMACTASLGAFEDLVGAPIVVRAAAMILIGVAGTTVVVSATDESNWWLLVGGIAVVGLVNVVNFMDGVNGMSALHGVIAGVSLAYVGADHEHWLVVSGLALAGAYAAFLPWNIRGRMFLGDAGSYLLGGTVAMCAVLGWMRGLPIEALAGSMVIYVADTGVTLTSRVVTGEKWYESHRDHTYQRLNRIGLGHMQVTVIVATASSVCAVAGIVAGDAGGSTRLLAVAVLVGVVGIYTFARLRISLPEVARGMQL